MNRLSYIPLIMMLFVLLCALTSSVAEDGLRQILKSPKATLELYNNFKAGEGLKYNDAENRMRFRLFRKNVELVADLNELEKTAVYALNFFSSMTRNEKKQYLGLNITEHHAISSVRRTLSTVPESKLWTTLGAVTEVKNQGSCGSCWTFGAVGGLETRYHQESGKLRNFAEQEYLDCVYEGKRDGCQGGLPDDAYSYSQRNGGRLAATTDYEYTHRDEHCLKNSKPDAMVATKIDGFVTVGRTEADNIEALVTGSLSVAFEVTDAFQQYKGGIMKDTTCHGEANHAVTAVGYTPEFVLVKNSWGRKWGDDGFVKFSRNYGNCGLFLYSSYPKLRSTGNTDTTASDAATTYNPDDDTPDPNCKDNYSFCSSYIKYCPYTNWSQEYCAKTCKLCDAGEECPSGTVRCSDGVCRHEHMCH